MAAHQKDDLEQWFTGVIFGTAKGLTASLIRLFLWLFSLLFRLVVSLRLFLLRHGWKEQAVIGVPVLSIGNITMGGTGKTPVVELFSRELQKRGRKVAILSRGYKSESLPEPQRWTHPETGKTFTSPPRIVSDGTEVLLDAHHAGDEPRMLAGNLPGVAVVVDPDRARGGRFAVGPLGCDILVLDDGMQNFGLAHSIDVVLVDQSRPFGVGGMIPRGTLREPPASLRRADYLFITKCDGSSNQALIGRLRHYNPRAGIVECAHGPRLLQSVFNEEKLPLSALEGRYIAAISGIAVPKSFEKLLKQQGAKVEFHRSFPDHHPFTPKEIESFVSRCLLRGIEMILTTEKDAVRFPRPAELDIPVYFLRIEVEVLAGREVFEDCLHRLCHSPAKSPEAWAAARLNSLPVP